MEDRFCAIRAAIGTAQARDVVVIAGKGNQDYQEYGDGQGGVIKVRAIAYMVLPAPVRLGAAAPAPVTGEDVMNTRALPL